MDIGTTPNLNLENGRFLIAGYGDSHWGICRCTGMGSRRVVGLLCTTWIGVAAHTLSQSSPGPRQWKSRTAFAVDVFCLSYAGYQEVHRKTHEEYG
jgi:hypothetical protein